MSLYSVNHHAFDVLSREVVYWIGFLLADVSVNDHNCISLTLRVSDKTHILHLREFVQSTHPVRRCRTFLPQTRKWYAGYKWSFTSKRIAGILARYNVVPRKSGRARVPDILRYNRNFWRGLVDGNGHIVWYKNLYPRCGLTGSVQTCRRFAEFAQRILQRTLDVPHHDKPGVGKDKQSFQVSLHGQRCVVLLRYLYDCDRPVLDRKARVARAMFDWQPRGARRFTVREQREAVRLCKAGRTVTEIGRALGRPYQSVIYLLKRLGHR